MKLFYSSVLLATAIAFTGCKAKITDDSDKQRVDEQNAKWPAYSDQSLAGKILGNDWAAVSAVARVSDSNANELDIYFYGESVTNACNVTPITNKAFAVINHIPADYAVTEFKTDLYDANQDKKPITFVETGLSITASTADRSRVSISSIDATGFQVYAWAITVPGIFNNTTSEINGQIHVTDCRKMVAFSEWTALKGNYKLQAFDGVTQNLRPLVIQEDPQDKFYDNASGTYLNALPFPLYYSVSSGSDAQYSFGPMDGVGTSKVSTTATTKTLQYSFNGPINYNNKDITLILDMTATKQDQYLYVEYTLEIPGFVTKTSHKFTLVKSQF